MYQSVMERKRRMEGKERKRKRHKPLKLFVRTTLCVVF
jgi:hypothetical protein